MKDKKNERIRDFEKILPTMSRGRLAALGWLLKNIDFMEELLKGGRLAGADLGPYLRLGREKKDDYLFMIAGYLQARAQQWREETAVTPSGGAEPPGR